MVTVREVLRRTTLTLGVTAIFFAVGCSSAAKKEETGIPTAAAADENSMGDSDSGKAMGLQTVHFAFDSSSLNEEAKRTLKENADILNAKNTLRIQIEGHCDHKGGIQYNIALGERRANAARKFLEDLGISQERMTVISFGKEKPMVPGASEEADAKNRRANFVITGR